MVRLPPPPLPQRTARPGSRSGPITVRRAPASPPRRTSRARPLLKFPPFPPSKAAEGVSRPSACGPRRRQPSGKATAAPATPAPGAPRTREECRRRVGTPGGRPREPSGALSGTPGPSSHQVSATPPATGVQGKSVNAAWAPKAHDTLALNNYGLGSHSGQTFHVGRRGLSDLCGAGARPQGPPQAHRAPQEPSTPACGHTGRPDCSVPTGVSGVPLGRAALSTSPGTAPSVPTPKD